MLRSKNGNGTDRKEKLRCLSRAWLDVEITDEEYQAERGEVARKLEALNPPEMQDMAQTAMTVRTLDDAWPRATEQEEHDILRIIFEAVYVDMENGTITGLVSKPPFRVFFGGGGKEEDLAQLCKVGQELYQ